MRGGSGGNPVVRKFETKYIMYIFKAKYINIDVGYKEKEILEMLNTITFEYIIQIKFYKLPKFLCSAAA
jgi:hypothetical protein